MTTTTFATKADAIQELAGYASNCGFDPENWNLGAIADEIFEWDESKQAFTLADDDELRERWDSAFKHHAREFLVSASENTVYRADGDLYDEPVNRDGEEVGWFDTLEEARRAAEEAAAGAYKQTTCERDGLIVSATYFTIDVSGWDRSDEADEYFDPDDISSAEPETFADIW